MHGTEDSEGTSGTSGPPLTVAVLGETGFVGRLVAQAVRQAGHRVCRVPAVRVEGAYGGGDSLEHAIARWLDEHSDAADALSRHFAGVDVVVNAAGMAEPDSHDIAALYGANSVLPGVAAEIAAAAGVRRLVHISSAAVQGRRSPLDESADMQPLTAYGRSKAAAEELLLGGRVRTPEKLVVYRPTSVMGASR